jgi:hypothetical protein
LALGAIAGHWLDQQGAMRGAVKHTQFPGSIHGDKTLAPLFRDDLGNALTA